MANNILLDSFKWSTLDDFIDCFRQLNLNVRFAMYHGDTHPHHNGKSDDIEFSGTHEISRGISFDEVPWLLTCSDLEALSRYEGIYFDILLRHSTTPANWSPAEMSEHYFLALNFWKYKLTQLNISACFAYFTPHEPCSVSLYILTKHLRIPYIFIDSPMIAGSIRFFSCSFSERNLLVKSASGESDRWVQGVLRTYGQNLKNDFGRAIPPEIRHVLAVQSKENSSLRVRDILNFFWTVGDRVLGAVRTLAMKPSRMAKIPRYLFQRFFPRGPMFYKTTGYSWSCKRAVFGRVDWLFFKFRMSLRLRLKKIAYRRLCTDISSLGSYIYFAAPLQPEASTTPAALWNSDIYIFLKPLIEAAPPGWKIVYKASPLEFSDLASSSSFIEWYPCDFYDKLSETGRVLFVREDTSTLDLIDGAKGVACINGTVAIEAVHRGKRAITRGPMWYDGIDGIHLCGCREQLDSAFDLMVRNVPIHPEIEKVKFCHESVFEFKAQAHESDRFIENEFAHEIVPQMANKMRLTLLRFNGLDDRKWKI